MPIAANVQLFQFRQPMTAPVSEQKRAHRNATNKLKHFRRFATRYDRRADDFLAFVHLAAICIWLR